MPIIIDGNNLLFAMHEHAPIPNVGRETMLRIIEQFAKQTGENVTVIFDGPRPLSGLGEQFRSPSVVVQFSAPQTADDVIVAMIHGSQNSGSLQVVTADRAIAHEARHRRCFVVAPKDFIDQVFARPDSRNEPPATQSREKPTTASKDEAEELLRLIEGEGLDPRDDRELFDSDDLPTE